MAKYLVNAARTFIFSTAIPPPAAAAALAALEILEEEPRRVHRLASNAAALRAELVREGFDLQGSRTQIMPIVVGEAGLATRICDAALARGVFAQAIRPPTVPAGTSRLRLAVMASHRAAELADAARTLAQVARAAGFEPRAAPRLPQAPELVEVEVEDEDERMWRDPDEPRFARPFDADSGPGGRPFDADSGHAGGSAEAESNDPSRPFDYEAPAPIARAA
jgi:glycine C-acetyltransferase/8-amino-7-oxononanoate synthase